MPEFNESNDIRYGTLPASKVYLGADLVWFVDDTSIQWGPHEVLAAPGAFWATLPALDTGDDLFDAFGIQNIVGTIGSKLELQFLNTSDLTDFMDECSLFTVLGVTMDVADANPNGGGSVLYWDNADGIAAAAAGDGQPLVSGSYELNTAPNETIFDIDFTTMTSSTAVYVNGSTEAAIPGTDLEFENWGASTGQVWKVGSGGTQGIEPYKSNVHLYKSANGSSQFSDGIVTDIGTLPGAFIMEGVIAEGGTNDNADYGFLVACDYSGDNVIRAGIINGNENTLEIRTRTNGGNYVDTVLPIQNIGSADRQFMRTTFDGTTITVEAWDGTDDTGTKLGTVTRDVTGLNMGTYFGFLGGKGISNSTQGRSCFSMKLANL